MSHFIRPPDSVIAEERRSTALHLAQCIASHNGEILQRYAAVLVAPVFLAKCQPGNHVNPFSILTLIAQ